MSSRYRHAAFLLLATSILLAAPGSSFAALRLTVILEPAFGRLFSGAANRQFILNTDDTISGPDAADYLDGARSGELEVHNTGKVVTLNIVVENITPTGGVTVNAALCRYHNLSQVACDGGGMTVNGGPRRALYVGLDISTSQTHSGGENVSISMDVTVTII